MNINKLVQSINKAKKIRRVLPYHRNAISGIDVDDKLRPNVLKTMRELFKTFKLYNFDIQVSHWGEIMIIEPNRQIKVILSVGYFEQNNKILSVKKALKNCEYFTSDRINAKSREILLRIKVGRANTRDWDYQFSEIENGNISAENIAEQIIKITSSLTTTTTFDHYKKFGQLTIEDILAIAKYGAVLYGRKTLLYYFVRDKDIQSYPQKIVISKYEIKVDIFNGDAKSFLLNTKAVNLFALLPINFESGEYIIER